MRLLRLSFERTNRITSKWPERIRVPRQHPRRAEAACCRNRAGRVLRRGHLCSARQRFRQRAAPGLLGRARRAIFRETDQTAAAAAAPLNTTTSLYSALAVPFCSSFFFRDFSSQRWSRFLKSCPNSWRMDAWCCIVELAYRTPLVRRAFVSLVERVYQQAHQSTDRAGTNGMLCLPPAPSPRGDEGSWRTPLVDAGERTTSAPELNRTKLLASGLQDILTSQLCLSGPRDLPRQAARRRGDIALRRS